MPWCGHERITEPGQVTGRVLDRFNGELLERGGKRGPPSRYSVASFVESVNSSLVMIQRDYAHATPADAHEMLAKPLSAE